MKTDGLATAPLRPVDDCTCMCCMDGFEMVRCYGYASPHACMCASCSPDERCDCAFCKTLLKRESN